jgi:signal transduction histidine kinase
MNTQLIAAQESIRRAFPGIPDPEVEELVSIGEVTSYAPDTVLCKENQVEDTFFVILDGEVEVTKTINDMQDRFLNHLSEGDFFGEMGLIHNAPRVATVTTTKPTQVLEIRKSTFERLLRQSSSISLAMMMEVSRRLRENDEMAVEDLRLKAGELAAAYQRMAQEEHARREFLTTIAHELRTPLTSASGFLAIAHEGNTDEETRNMALGTVRRNVSQIISLVNDILFLQEVELVLPEMHPTDMSEVVSNAMEKVRQKATRSNIRLFLDMAPDAPLVSGHFRSLQRAIEHLLDNAIKFSPDGGDVHISVGRYSEGTCVFIRDQGIGIPEEFMPQIFDRYFHKDKVGDELYSGLGLGLSIAKQVIEQHNGKIEAQSTEGQGSTFSIFLCEAPQVGEN